VRWMTRRVMSARSYCEEDYFAAAALTEEDKAQLAGPVACPYLPTKEEYLAGGFLRTSTRTTLNRRSKPARVYERPP